MIVDYTKNLARYEGINPRFEAAFKFFFELLEKNVPDGKYFMPNADVENAVYVMIGTKTLQAKESLVAESHVRYIDIQAVLEGGEVMCVPSTACPEVSIAYNPEKDIAKYAPVGMDECHVAKIAAGEFAIFLNNELHIPETAPFGGSDTVRKAVIKVLA